jgi:glycine oxidase
MHKLDYIIVGQGLAGSLLAVELLRRNKKLCVVDHPQQTKASEVAAGMFNPLVFKRAVKSWMADDLLPFMKNYYQGLEDLLGRTFLYEMDVFKLLSTEEVPFWEGKDASGSIAPYLFKLHSGVNIKGIRNAAGLAQITQSGRVDLPLLLSSLKGYIQEKALLLETGFDYHELAMLPHSVQWKGMEAGHVVFCEGAYAIHNPYFNFVPYYLTQGDVLTLEIDGLKEDRIVNKNIYLLPIGQKRFLLGSTYIHGGLSFEKKNENQAYLTHKLDQILDLPYIVSGHKTGVRPTVKDRRPVLGLHPVFPHLAYFNGLGTKGVMLAPYFAHEMAGLLESGIPVNKETRIERFKNMLKG